MSKLVQIKYDTNYSERTIASHSKENPDTQLFGARRTGAWQCQVGATPICHKNYRCVWSKERFFLQQVDVAPS